MDQVITASNRLITKSKNPANRDFFGLTKLNKEETDPSTKRKQKARSSLPIPEIIIDDDDNSQEVVYTGTTYKKEYPAAQALNFDFLDHSQDSNTLQPVKKVAEVLIEEEEEMKSQRSGCTVILDDTMIIEDIGEGEVQGKLEKLEEEIQPRVEEDADQIQFLENSDPEKPLLWLNKLKFYPPQSGFQNTLSFRELLYEDLLKGDPDYPVRTLQSAFFTTYGYDLSLIEPLLKAGVRITLANDWNSLEEPRVERNAEGFENLTIVRPYKDLSRPNSGVFHAKLWILKFPNFLRVVVGSGNLCVPQWVMWSNCFWFQDFPLKTSVRVNKDKARKYKNHRFDRDKDFVETLESFIVGMLPKWVNYTDLLGFSLEEYFFSDIDIVLIPSIPGRHYKKDFDKYGHRKVAHVLKQMTRSRQGRNSGNQVLTYQSTSLSSLDRKFLSELLTSFIPGSQTLEDLMSLKAMKDRGEAESEGDMISDRVRLIYPSRDYVENSKDGPIFARPLKLTPEGYAKKNFPRDIFHQFESPEEGDVHTGMIPHLKVGIVSNESGEIDDDTVVYFGSHNLTPAAWGKYERNYTTLVIGNTELGVLYPPGKGTKERKERMVGGLSFRFPPRKYEEGQVPWVMKLHLKVSEA